MTNFVPTENDYNIILSYFPDLSVIQKIQFSQLNRLYTYWNARINLVSRQDIHHLYERHVLYSLGIYKALRFKPGSKILDVGTGGGFPGIPLAIMCPSVKFHLIDSIAKKVAATQQIVQDLGLTNVKVEQYRVEKLSRFYDFVVGRGVTQLSQFYHLAKPKVSTRQSNELLNGIFYLTGGDITAELAKLSNIHCVYPVQTFFQEPFFKTKKVVYFPINSLHE